MLSIMFMTPLSHSHEALGIKSAPALPKARQKRRSGSSRKCLVQTLRCTVVLQWQKAKWKDPSCFLLQDSCSPCRWSEEHDTTPLFRAQCIFSWLAAGIRVICVCPLCHCRVSLSLPSSGLWGLPCQHSHLAETCPPFQTGGRALTQPEHCHFSHCGTS